MKNNKTGFSPWHTKQVSFDSDHEDLLDTLPTLNFSNKIKSSSKLTKQGKNTSQKKTVKPDNPLEEKIACSYSKTESLAFSKEQQQNMNLTQRKFKNRSISSRKTQKTGRQFAQTLNEPILLFDDQKWKMLTIASNDRFLNEHSEIRKYQKFVEELKSRRTKVSAQRPFSTINVQVMRDKEMENEIPLKNQTINSLIPLQQVSVKNFIMHGHYSDKETISIQQNGKRREGVNFALKQKFATLKKNQNTKQNQPHSAVNGRRKVVVAGGKSNKDKENLFNVIKLERKINNQVCLDTKMR